MTTLTAATETHWDELCEEVDECSFDELPSPECDLESEIGDMLAEDPSEDLLSLSKSVSVSSGCSIYMLKTTETQHHIATALGSALHQTLAKYSAKNTRVHANPCEKPDRAKSTQPGHHLNEISEFWDGWFDDIEIDEEINSVDNENHTAEETSQRKRVIKTPHSTVNAEVLRKIAPIPTCVLKPLIIDVTSKSKSEVTSLFLKTKGKNSEIISSGSSESESNDKSRRHSSKRNASNKTKRKLNMVSGQMNDTLTAEKKSKAHKKKLAKHLHDFKEVFKMEQVLKIKSVEQDCEDEEVDIGDLTDTVPN